VNVQSETGQFIGDKFCRLGFFKSGSGIDADVAAIVACRHVVAVTHLLVSWQTGLNLMKPSCYNQSDVTQTLIGVSIYQFTNKSLLRKGSYTTLPS